MAAALCYFDPSTDVLPAPPLTAMQDPSALLRSSYNFGFKRISDRCLAVLCVSSHLAPLPSHLVVFVGAGVVLRWHCTLVTLAGSLVASAQWG